MHQNNYIQIVEIWHVIHNGTNKEVFMALGRESGLSLGFGSKFNMYKYFQLLDVFGGKATKNVCTYETKILKKHTRSIR